MFKNCINLNKKNNFINKRLLQETTYCDKNTIFDSERTCKINTQTANQEIIEGLNTIEYREFLINIFNEKNTIVVSEDNELFSITITKFDEKIQLGECEITMRKYYHIYENEYIYLYRHEVNKTYYKIPIINFKLFNNITVFNTGYCTDPIEYILPVTINEDDLYLYNSNKE